MPKYEASPPKIIPHKKGLPCVQALKNLSCYWTVYELINLNFFFTKNF